MSIMDLALTKGMGDPFDILTLERIAKQTEQKARGFDKKSPGVTVPLQYKQNS